MKSTGIVRDVDNLGRIVIPIELRRTLGINEKDSVEIYTENDTIILRKYQESCIFCGSTESVSDFRNKNICEQCRFELTNLRK
ncbi:MAG: AbrB/MazE/SpoVT family DNA-binding domain-containing protein [Ruminococcus sp.]|nr:AbrB/MazE/SpoVT family DNA-binding domain-containing protein [Ruminococcus sp.]